MFDKLKGRFDEQDSLSQQPSRAPPIPNAGSNHNVADVASSSHKIMQTESKSDSVFKTHFASVSLHRSDRIRLMGLPLEVRDAVRNRILQTWPSGLQEEREYYGSWEFKLRGTPWAPYGEDAIHARRLTRGVMATLYSHGWVLYITTDLSMKPGDKDNLFFRHQDPTPAPCDWFSCTFSRGDKLRLIDAPNSVVADIVEELRPLIQRHEPYQVAGAYEIKFKGNPWAAQGGETMVSRSVALKLFEVLERNGFTVYASIDQKFGGQHGQETDSWHVSRPTGWMPGAPVYHQ